MNIKTPKLDAETRKAIFFVNGNYTSIEDVPAGTVKAAHSLLSEKAEASVSVHVMACVAKYRLAMADHWKELASKSRADLSMEPTPKTQQGEARN